MKRSDLEEATRITAGFGWGCGALVSAALMGVFGWPAWVVAAIGAAYVLWAVARIWYEASKANRGQ